MSLQVRFSAEAVAELEAAATWYEDQLPGLGGAFIGAIDSTLSRVADWPRSGAPVPAVSSDLDVRRVPVARFPHNLPYIVMDEVVVVLAVAHDRRLPGYWKRRTRSWRDLRRVRPTVRVAVRVVADDRLMAQQLMDVHGVAERLGVSERHIRRLVFERRIPFIKWGHLLQERMGHSSVIVTLDRYGHLFDGLDMQIADGLDDIMKRSRGLTAACDTEGVSAETSDDDVFAGQASGR